MFSNMAVESERFELLLREGTVRIMTKGYRWVPSHLHVAILAIVFATLGRFLQKGTF